MTLAQLDVLLRVHGDAARRRRTAEDGTDRGRPVAVGQWAAMVTERG